MAQSADLIVRNGTVVTADATFPADVAINDGSSPRSPPRVSSA